MTVSQEFQLGINLIEKFQDQLKAIAQAKTPEEAKPLIESIKHPVTGAMAQIKVGTGPLKEEILEPLGVVVAQMRELTDFEALKNSITDLLHLVEQVKEAQQAE